MRDRRMAPRDWSISNVPDRQCTAHKRNGDRCKNAAIRGGAVCGWHGGRAPAVKAKARLRLELAADRMAKALLGIATDTNVPESVRLAAVKDALDRAGLKPATTVDLEVSAKPWEAVFEGIAKVVAGPRNPEDTPALDAVGGSALESASEDDDVIVGEIDEDPLPEDDEIESARDIEDAIDVEIIADDYTDSPGTTTSPDPSSALSVEMSGPHNFGLMTLADASEQAAAMNRHAARMRQARRR